MPDIHPENARARRDQAASLSYHNKTPAIVQAEARIELAQLALDKLVAAEFPVGTIVTVENLHQGARFIRGPVVAHSKAAHYKRAGLFVNNLKTGKTRHVSLSDFIYKEAAE